MKVQFIFWPCPRGVDVPWPGIEPTWQQWPKPLQSQSRILNPLCHKRTTTISFYKDANHIGLGPIKVTSCYPNYLFKGLFSKSCHILRYWGLGHQHMSFGKDKTKPVTHHLHQNHPCPNYLNLPLDCGNSFPTSSQSIYHSIAMAIFWKDSLF